MFLAPEPIMKISLATIAQDVRYALRQLRSAPGFTATAVLTLALGIGANTAIFTLAHGILLRQLPVPDPNSLYRIGNRNDCCIEDGVPGGQQYSIFSTESYERLRDATSGDFKQLAAMSASSGNGPGLARRGESDEAARPVRSTYVSGNYFETFEVKPELGRLIAPADDRDGAPPVAVMNYATWLVQYQSDPSIVGSTFLLDSHPVTIIGIAPKSFYGERVSERVPDFYLPIAAESDMDAMRTARNPELRWLYLIGRVKAGIQLPFLQQKINLTLRNYEASRADYSGNQGKLELRKVRATLVSVAAGIQQDEDTVEGIRILFWIAGLVMLIACANLANLFLVRGMTRRAETSVRLALGAARSRIAAQTLTESLTLALMGALIGVVLAFAGTTAMVALAFPRAHNMPLSTAPSLPILLFTLALALATGLLCGIVPAWSTTRGQPSEALRGRNRSSRDSGSIPQRGLVLLQAVLSLVMITVAALLTSSLTNLERQPFGLETENRFVVHIDPIASGYTQDRLQGLMRSLGDRINALPGTQSVAFANYSPLEGNSWTREVFAEGKPDPSSAQDNRTTWMRVSPGFFNTIGERLRRGRDFTIDDRAGSPLVCVVNESFVHKYFSGQDPIGKRFGTESSKPIYTIIGVVADAKLQDPALAVQPVFFRSMLQPNPNAEMKDVGERYSLAPHAVLIETVNKRTGYEAQLRRAFMVVDPNLTILSLHTLDAQVSILLSEQRMIARLASAFGLLALVLASVGLYGVTSYMVSQRVPEIGIRMALGSDRVGVLNLILRGSMLQTIFALMVGVPAALLAGHYLQSQLFGVKGADLRSLLGACAVLGISALIASIIPARRASSVDPMQVLRSE
jgi:macrolide transport system ATP-binding/permease protein